MDEIETFTVERRMTVWHREEDAVLETVTGTFKQAFSKWMQHWNHAGRSQGIRLYAADGEMLIGPGPAGEGYTRRWQAAPF